jgi:tight adherence protein B
VVVSFLMGGKVSSKRMARVTSRRGGAAAVKATDAMSLRRKAQGGRLPMLSKVLQNFTSTAALQEKMQRAGMRMSSEMFIAICVGLIILPPLLFVLLKKPVAAGLILGLFIGIIIPRFVLNFRANKRLKKFLVLFPDAIDFIVRGLRSGLPVTESMNMVGVEMEQPVGGIFAGIGESVKLGVSLEKALQDTAKRLKSTEFNFFATSIVLQRETGGNLSEILNNLSDVLRKRYMMRMKIKAMSSEAKASAMIVGSLPFIVIGALSFIAPDYLTPLWTERSGNIAAGCAILSLTIGITVMIKMSHFEI